MILEILQQQGEVHFFGVLYTLKQWDDPKSISVLTESCSEMVSIIKRELGLERAAALK
jgi:hypothetical protein